MMLPLTPEQPVPAGRRSVLVAGLLVCSLVLMIFAAQAQAASGDLDSSFAAGGRQSADFGGADSAYGVAVQPDGKTVVAGTGANGGDFPLARYNVDGTLDTTFSDDGVQIADIPGGVYGALAVALQADGKIVVAGFTGGSQADFAVARFNADGTLDTTFSGDGVQTTDFGRDLEYGRAVAVQADGKIVVAGMSQDGAVSDFALARYGTDGTLDATFSDDGRLTTDFGGRDRGFGVALQADGKIVVAGAFQNGLVIDFALARYGTDGTLDATFSDDGKQTTDFGGFDEGAAVAVQADGKIVVAGTSNQSTAGSAVADFAVARYDAAGDLDPTFAGDGRQTTGFGGTGTSGGLDAGAAVALQADGKIVVGGTANQSESGSGPFGGHFGLARYSSGGELDPTFACDGTRTTSFPGSQAEIGYGAAVSPGGEIVVAGASNVPLYNDRSDFAVARYEGGSVRGGCGPSDTIPPNTTIDSGPFGTVSKADAAFTYASSELGSSFQCKLDSGAFASCPVAGKSYTGLADGPHTFSVRAIDVATNVDPTPASRAFIVDTKVSGAKATAAKTQKQSGRQIKLKLSAKASEAVSAKASGKIKVGKRSYKLGPQTARVKAGKPESLKLKPKRSKDKGKIATALRKGRKVKASLEVKFADKVNNKATKKLTVKLK